ncbi:Kinesin-like protein KIF21A, partial [Zancudomyces culisetae]
MTFARVNVALRIRPLSKKETGRGDKSCVKVIPGTQQVTIGGDRSFTFDKIYSAKDTQAQVYEESVKPMIERFLEGYNATVMAYGQTSSGKTYSMGTGAEVGEKEIEKGIVPRGFQNIVEELENRKNRQKGFTYNMEVSFIELYNEEVFNLLDTQENSNKIQKIVYGKGTGKSKSKETSGTKNRVEENGIKMDKVRGSAGGLWTNIRRNRVDSEEEMINLLKLGGANRTTGATDMNANSSRSHAIYTVVVEQITQETESDSRTKTRIVSKIHFVDLAGSERIKQTNAMGNRVKEGISINSGLLALGNVISSLGDALKRQLHIPYRNSKLTRLLEDSLGGNSMTLMLACITETEKNYSETLSTLRYANRARNIKNKVVVGLSTIRDEVGSANSGINEEEGGGKGVDDNRNRNKRSNSGGNENKVATKTQKGTSNIESESLKVAMLKEQIVMYESELKRMEELFIKAVKYSQGAINGSISGNGNGIGIGIGSTSGSGSGSTSAILENMTEKSNYSNSICGSVSSLTPSTSDIGGTSGTSTSKLKKRRSSVASMISRVGSLSSLYHKIKGGSSHNKGDRSTITSPVAEPTIDYEESKEREREREKQVEMENSDNYNNTVSENGNTNVKKLEETNTNEEIEKPVVSEEGGEEGAGQKEVEEKKANTVTIDEESKWRDILGIISSQRREYLLKIRDLQNKNRKQTALLANLQDSLHSKVEESERNAKAAIAAAAAKTGATATATASESSVFSSGINRKAEFTKTSTGIQMKKIELVMGILENKIDNRVGASKLYSDRDELMKKQNSMIDKQNGLLLQLESAGANKQIQDQVELIDAELDYIELKIKQVENELADLILAENGNYNPTLVENGVKIMSLVDDNIDKLNKNDIYRLFMGNNTNTNTKNDHNKEQSVVHVLNNREMVHLVYLISQLVLDNQLQINSLSSTNEQLKSEITTLQKTLSAMRKITANVASMYGREVESRASYITNSSTSVGYIAMSPSQSNRSLASINNINNINSYTYNASNLTRNLSTATATATATATTGNPNMSFPDASFLKKQLLAQPHSSSPSSSPSPSPTTNTTTTATTNTPAPTSINTSSGIKKPTPLYYIGNPNRNSLQKRSSAIRLSSLMGKPPASPNTLHSPLNSTLSLNGLRISDNSTITSVRVNGLRKYESSSSLNKRFSRQTPVSFNLASPNPSDPYDPLGFSAVATNSLFSNNASPNLGLRGITTSPNKSRLRSFIHSAILGTTTSPSIFNLQPHRLQHSQSNINTHHSSHKLNNPQLLSYASPTSSQLNTHSLQRSTSLFNGKPLLQALNLNPSSNLNLNPNSNPNYTTNSNSSKRIYSQSFSNPTAHPSHLTTATATSTNNNVTRDYSNKLINSNNHNHTYKNHEDDSTPLFLLPYDRNDGLETITPITSIANNYQQEQQQQQQKQPITITTTTTTTTMTTTADTSVADHITLGENITLKKSYNKHDAYLRLQGFSTESTDKNTLFHRSNSFELLESFPYPPSTHSASTAPTPNSNFTTNNEFASDSKYISLNATILEN